MIDISYYVDSEKMEIWTKKYLKSNLPKDTIPVRTEIYKYDVCHKC
jgi:hypothetical protein